MRPNVSIFTNPFTQFGAGYTDYFGTNACVKLGVWWGAECLRISHVIHMKPLDLSNYTPSLNRRVQLISTRRITMLAGKMSVSQLNEYLMKKGQ